MLTTFPFWLLFFNVISVSSATRSRLRRLKRLDNYIIMLEPQLNLAHAILYMNVCFSTFLSGAPNSVCHFSWLSIDMIVVKHKNSFMWVGAWGTINRIKWHIFLKGTDSSNGVTTKIYGLKQPSRTFTDLIDNFLEILPNDRIK